MQDHEINSICSHLTAEEKIDQLQKKNLNLARCQCWFLTADSNRFSRNTTSGLVSRILFISKIWSQHVFGPSGCNPQISWLFANMITKQNWVLKDHFLKRHSGPDISGRHTSSLTDADISRNCSIIKKTSVNSTRDWLHITHLWNSNSIFENVFFSTFHIIRA